MKPKEKNPQDTTLRNHRSLLRKIKLLKEELEVQCEELLCLRNTVHNTYTSIEERLQAILSVLDKKKK